MNPYVVLGAILLAGAGGWELNNWRRDSQELAIERAAEKAGDKATDSALAAIKGLQPRFTTINKAVERETRTEVRYSNDACSHTAATWGMLDQAYQAAGGEPFGSGPGLPAPAPAAGH